MILYRDDAWDEITEKEYWFCERFIISTDFRLMVYSIFLLYRGSLVRQHHLTLKSIIVQGAISLESDLVGDVDFT
jgi:hypothetical protein